jgi:hypothetical protein
LHIHDVASLGQRLELSGRRRADRKECGRRVVGRNEYGREDLRWHQIGDVDLLRAG